MKRTIIFVITLMMALCVGLALSGCSSEEYTPEKKQQTVSDSALHTAGVLRVGVDASSAPYAAESSGQIVGINVDIAAALADEMGLKLELVDVGTNASRAFSTEDVDIVMGVSSEDSSYWLSSSYMESAVALFASETSTQAPSTSDSSFKVAAQSSSMSAWEVTDQYGESHLLDTTDLQSAFASLGNDAQYVAADSVIGAYVAHSSNVSAYAIALLQDPTTQSIAVEASNSDLRSGVETALKSISDGGIITVITQKWLGNPVDISTLSVLKNQASTTDNSSENTTDNSSEQTDSNASDDQAVQNVTVE